MTNYKGAFADTIFLSIARAILRKQQRDQVQISETEACGHAMVIQGRYNFVQPHEVGLFCAKVVHAFRFVSAQQVTSVSKLAYLDFQKDEFLGNSILDDELIRDLEEARSF